MKKLVFLFLISAILFTVTGCNAPESVPEPSPIPSIEPSPEATPREFTFESQPHSFSVDMDGDGTDDDITVVLYTDEPIGYNVGRYEHIDITINGVTNRYHGENFTEDITLERLIPGSVQICLPEYGFSHSYATLIISYDGEVISKCKIGDFIIEYDGNGKILTEHNYLYIANGNRPDNLGVFGPQWSYWQYDSGDVVLTPVDKSELIGKTLTFDIPVPITFEPDKMIISYLVALHYADDIEVYTSQFGGNFSFLLESGEEAEIIDVDFIDWTDIGYTWPWFKVKAPDGSEGWMSAISLSS